MNVLITADIHLGDYPDFNYSANSRIKQFETLALRLGELGKQYDCKECWILGDFLRVSNPRIRIQHRLKEFLDKVCSEFDTVRYILGQHDLEAKSDEFSLEDTLVSIPDLPNFKYMDKQVLEVDGHKIAFASWTPSQNLDWLDHCDLLCGHYTKSTLFGQEIDESKFDLMIHGDIHNDQVIDKFVSVGNPIQHDYNSQPDGTCVVLSTEDLSWKHIKVDEDKTRFLRMYYTEDPNNEGFRGPLEYYQYKPVISQTEIITDVKPMEWSDVDELISKVMFNHNLMDIHQEIVSKISNVTEIDFNIQLVSLDIIGYRSIIKFHIDFNRNDRIILLGDNGSGKSSIIRALKSIFEKNAGIVNEHSDLTDEESIVLKFVYQNKLVELTKGDNCRLIIDGEELLYNNKRDFENDLLIRFPFIQYLDILFIAAGSSNLSNQLTPQRKIELISKFYRLDRLTDYSNLAYDLHYEKIGKVNELKEELNKLIGGKTLVTRRLTELESVNIDSEDTLSDKLKSFSDMRESHQNFKDWKAKLDPLVARIAELEHSKVTYQSRLSINPEQVSQKIKELEVDVAKLDEMYDKEMKRSSELDRLNKELKVVTEKGTSLSGKVTQLELGICPECGNRLSTGKASELMESYQAELKELRQSYDEIYTKLSEYSDKEKSERYFITYLTRMKSYKKEKSDEILLLQNKLTQYEVAKSGLQTLDDRIAQLKAEVSALESNKPEEVKLPWDISEQEESLRSELNKISDKRKELTELDDYNSKIDELDNTISNMHENAMRYYRYGDLMSTTGEVLEEILKNLTIKFSNSEIKYEVESGTSYNKRYIIFKTFLKVRSRWRYYDTLSDGQKQICDLDFLNKLFSTRLGFLALDEYLRHLDDKNFPKCVDILMNMNVDTIILSTHDPNLSIYTKRILLELDENGATQSRII